MKISNNMKFLKWYLLDPGQLLSIPTENLKEKKWVLKAEREIDRNKIVLELMGPGFHSRCNAKSSGHEVWEWQKLIFLYSEEDSIE